VFEFYTKSIRMSDALLALHSSTGLVTPMDVKTWFGLFSHDRGLIGAVGVEKGLIQGLVIDSAYRGKDLTATLVEAVLREAMLSGESSLYVYTKPENARVFESIGFRRILEVKPYAYLLEWGEKSLSIYLEQLKGYRILEAGERGCVVVNCNPFTLGHQYLIQYAASRCDHLFVLVVEEDQSLFAFADRLEMIRLGTAHLNNVSLIPGGRYLVSALTFPSYFTRQEAYAHAQIAVDVSLFKTYIAPSLEITKRFIGTEPYSLVTAYYNQEMLRSLPTLGIEVEVLPRLTLNNSPISASRVRRLLQEDRWEELSEYVPHSTYCFLKRNAPHRNWYEQKGYIEDGDS